MYPADEVGRTILANELMARGFRPTQPKHSFSKDKISRIAEAMKYDSFDWAKASLQPIILGPNDEILGRHHRIVAAHLAEIDLTTISGPRPQIQRLPRNFRPEYLWIDVLPDVQ